MAEQITNYKCPACTGPLHFAGESGKLECDYCGSSFSIAEIEALYADDDAAAAENAAAAKPDAAATWGLEDGVAAYTCPSCGAQLICDETTAASSCPYCGNPTIVPGQLSGALKPEYVVPFKVSKEAAESALQNFYKGKKLLPNSFAAGNHIDDIKGIYVPFWLYDAEIAADVSFEGCREFSHSTPDETIIEREYYNVYRAGTVAFEKIPVNGAVKISDDHMDAIEPYDYADLKPFSNAYMPGYYADRFDRDSEESAPHAIERAGNSAVSILSDTVTGYDSKTLRDKHATCRSISAVYAMMPVWLLATKWQEQSFLFAVNGQTGKLVGELPIDKGKTWAWFGGVAAALMAIFFLLMAGGAMELNSVGIFLGIFIPLLIAFIVISIMKGSMKTANKRVSAGEYVVQNSLNVTAKTDVFSHRRTERIPRNNPQSQNNGGPARR